MFTYQIILRPLQFWKGMELLKIVLQKLMLKPMQCTVCHTMLENKHAWYIGRCVSKNDNRTYKTEHLHWVRKSSNSKWKIDNCPILWIWMLNTLSVVKLWETGIYPMIDVLHCVKSVCIGNYNCLYFLHLDWIWRDMESTCGKYGQEWLRIRILFMQCCLHIEKLWTYWILSCKLSMIIFLDFLTILLC